MHRVLRTPKLNFLELRHGEVLRIYVLGISVHEG